MSQKRHVSLKGERYLTRDIPAETRESRDMSYTATHCNTLQHTATHCNTLQHTATHCATMHQKRYVERDTQQPHLQKIMVSLKRAACTATHCNTLQQPYLLSKEHCSQSQKNRILQHTATHHNTLQHTATHCIKRAMGLLTKNPYSQSQKTRVLNHKRPVF